MTTIIKMTTIMKIFYFILLLGSIASITLLINKLVHKDSYQNVSNKHPKTNITLNEKTHIYCPNSPNRSCVGLCKQITHDIGHDLGEIQLVKCNGNNENYIIGTDRTECSKNNSKCTQTFQSNSELTFYCGNNELKQEKDGTFSCK